MKKRPVLITIFILLAFLAPNARTASYDSSDTTPLNYFNIAVIGSGSLLPGYFGGIGMGIGIADWGSLHLQGGFGTDTVGFATNNTAANSPYGRLLFKILLSRFFGGVDKVSLTVGPVYNKYFGAYSSLILTTTWTFLEFYTGLEDSVYFRPKTGGGVETGLVLNFLIGTKLTGKLDFIRIKRVVPELIVEIGIPLTSYSKFSLNAGIQYKIDFSKSKAAPGLQ